MGKKSKSGLSWTDRAIISADVGPTHRVLFQFIYFVFFSPAKNTPPLAVCYVGLQYRAHGTVRTIGTNPVGSDHNFQSKIARPLATVLHLRRRRRLQNPVRILTPEPTNPIPYFTLTHTDWAQFSQAQRETDSSTKAREIPSALHSVTPSHWSRNKAPGKYFFSLFPSLGVLSRSIDVVRLVPHHVHFSLHQAIKTLVFIGRSPWSSRRADEAKRRPSPCSYSNTP